MQEVSLNLLRFSQLNDYQKKVLKKFYLNKIYPSLMETERNKICRHARKNGVQIDYISFESIRGGYITLPEYVLESTGNSLFKENDVHFTFRKVYHKFLQSCLEKIKNYLREGKEEEVQVLYGKWEKDYEEWKREFLDFVLKTYLHRLQCEYVKASRDEFIEEYFNFNDYFFSESGGVYTLRDGGYRHVANVKFTE